MKNLPLTESPDEGDESESKSWSRFSATTLHPAKSQLTGFEQALRRCIKIKSQSSVTVKQVMLLSGCDWSAGAIMYMQVGQKVNL